VFSYGCLNFALSFLRIVRQCNKLLEIWCHHNRYFWKQGKLAFVLWRWCLFLAFILCIDELVWKFSWLLIMVFINESTCWHGTSRMSNFLNRLLLEVLGCASAIILIIFFCKVKISTQLKELTPQIIPYFIIEWLCTVDFGELILLILTIDLKA
jgi:hypothetical protein